MSKIKIRPQEIKDAKRLFEILSNPNFTYFSSTPKNLKDEVKYLRDSLKQLKKGTLYNYAILMGDEVIGGIGVKIVAHRKHIGEIGYFIDEKYWGKGIVVRAVKLLEKKCFNDLKLNRLEVLMQPKNTSSEKVAIKAGYKKEGLLKKVIKDKEGKLKDVYLYAKTK
jgi:RimJ/RimL family protein N-acetyltransferase